MQAVRVSMSPLCLKSPSLFSAKLLGIPLFDLCCPLLSCSHDALGTQGFCFHFLVLVT